MCTLSEVGPRKKWVLMGWMHVFDYVSIYTIGNVHLSLFNDAVIEATEFYSRGWLKADLAKDAEKAGLSL